MPISPVLRFVYGQTAWMLAVLLGLTVLGTLTYELFFMLSLVGFLALMEFTGPFEVTPRWRSRLKWIVLTGLLVLGYIATSRLYAVLLQELSR